MHPRHCRLIVPTNALSMLHPSRVGLVLVTRLDFQTAALLRAHMVLQRLKVHVMAGPLATTTGLARGSRPLRTPSTPSHREQVTVLHHSCADFGYPLCTLIIYVPHDDHTMALLAHHCPSIAHVNRSDERQSHTSH